jgi:hypothetical protein
VEEFIMKKIMPLPLLAGILFIFFGCASNRSITSVVQQEIEPQKATQVPLTKWMQNTYPAISNSDPVTFYNEFEIKIEAKISKRIMMFQDGITYYIDSSTVVSLTIPKLTPGVLVSVERNNNLPRIMEISFDANNPDYNIRFFVQGDKAFAQDKRSTITFDGKKYDAEAIAVSSGKLNYLLSNFEWLNLTNKIEDRAGGRNAHGTKIIQQE